MAEAGRLAADDTVAATRLAAAALVSIVGPATSVLDVGAGLGALALHARARGAGRVVGVERAAALVAAARRAHPEVEWVHADARDFLPTLPDAAFDVVVANLPAPPLVALVPELARVARRALVVAGARLWQGAAVRAAVARAGWPDAVASASDGWCAFVARRA